MDSRTLGEGEDGGATLDRLVGRWLELKAEGFDDPAEALCRGRPDLLDEFRRRIDDLRTTGRFEASSDGDGGSMTEDSGPPSSGPAGGPRKISSRVEFDALRYHAEGGLGEVFVARNTELNRDVALKFLKRGRAGDPDSRRRFLVEAEVTGRLEHPGVVPVYALGLDAEGVPCYAMRFIRGTTLHDAIEAFHKGLKDDLALARNPGFRGLLERFVAACNTIAYAHSRGVLHRDIKPRNIMIGKYDETLVVDWGLAKRFDQADGPAGAAEDDVFAGPDGADTSPETRGVVGTPQFMSPEQASPGQALGPPSDVYSLGATLYALLAARPPIRGGSLAAVLDDVRAGKFSPPRWINPDVPRPLEAICLKAMANRPEARYAGPLELAEEVKRWLADEPVDAWPDPWTTRLRRWLTRNRWRMAASLALLAAILAVPITISIVEARGRAKLEEVNRLVTEQRDETERVKRKDSAVRSFLDELFAQATPEKNPRGRKVTFEEALDQAASTIPARFRDQPDLEAEVRQTIGQTYQALGEYGKAEPHLIRARAIREASLPADDPDRIASVGSLAALWTDQGRYAESEPLHLRTLEAYRRKFGDDRPETLSALVNLAIVIQYQNRPAEAEPMIRRALAARTRTLGPEDPETLRARNDLATILHDLGRVDEAVALHRQILEARTRVLPEGHPATLTSMANLAAGLHDQGRFEEEEKLVRKADEGMARVLGEDHPERLTTLNNLAMLLQATNRPGEAEDAFRRVLEGRRRKLGPDNLLTVVTELAVADAAWNRGAMDGVEDAYRHVLRARRERLGDGHPLTLGPANNLAGLLMDRGRAAEAEAIMSWVVPAIRQKPELRTVLARTVMLRAVTLVDSGRPAEAEPLIREALAMRLADVPPDPMLIASSENLLGHCLAGLNRFAEAEALLLSSYPELVGPPAWPRLDQATRRIVKLYRDWSKPVEAARWQTILDDLIFPAEPFR